MAETLREHLARSIALLQTHSIEFPKTDAEWLYTHVLGCSRIDLYMNGEKIIDPNQDNVLKEKIERRIKREPLQYILGETEFYGKRFFTDRRALIPRPETEELVHQWVQKWPLSPFQNILELGTGSGVIAVTLASLFPHLKWVATDISEEALELAQINAQQHRVRHQIRFRRHRWFEGLEGKFDVIVGNPPYLSEEEWHATAPEIREFEPKGALTATDAGLGDIKHILSHGPKYLNPGGFILLETGMDQHTALFRHAQKYGYRDLQSTRDLCGRDRFFWAHL